MCGVARYLKSMNPEIHTVGVDPVGSIYTADTEADVHTYLIEGVGEDFYPENFDAAVIDSYEKVSDKEAFTMARSVAAQEGILVGGSGGMAVVGALRVAKARPDDLVVVIIPDSGRNYVSRIFNDDWMREKGMLDE